MGDILKPIKRGFNVLTHPGTYALHPLRAGKELLGVSNAGSNTAPAAATDNAIPYTDPTADAASARDKMRRQALRAQGIASTQRSSAATAPYSSAPKSLLGS